ncbi:MAG: hypothetical protein V1702_06255 [Candidatus Woesearchaeota archaeon]
MRNIIGDLQSLLYSDIIRRGKITPFIAIVSFILTFGIARLTVTYLPGFSIVWKEYHIHHFYYGILTLAVAGWIALVSNRERMNNLAAAFFGMGLGFITDEIGLMLTCASPAKECDYLARQSYDLAIIIVLLFLNIIYFKPFWRKARWPLLKLIGLMKNHNKG